MRRVTRWLSVPAVAAISVVTLTACATPKPERPGLTGEPLPSTTTTTTTTTAVTPTSATSTTTATSTPAPGSG